MEYQTWKLRSMSARIAAASAMVIVAAALAACGSSSSSSSSSSGGTSSGSGSSSGGSADVNSADAKQFRQLIGISDADFAKLKGKTFKVGAILPLSGQGANFAIDEGNGVKLAVDEMKRFMGMDIQYTAKDHKSGDPQAGAQAARELGIDNFGVAINSYYGVFGSTLPSIQQYKMLSFDPGGGTGNSLKGKNYFWGFRANTPDDGFFGLKYFKAQFPNAKKVAQLIWDAGAAYTAPILAHLKAQVAANGMQFVGQILSPIGATDYSTQISKLKNLNPDIIEVALFGGDPGYFMKQYVTSGLNAKILGGEYVPAAAKIAGAAYKNYWFGADYFDNGNPPNPLSKFFLKDYQRLFGGLPGTFYEPNYYEATLAYLQLAARVIEKGGNINDGSALNSALLADPTFKSVYGGDASTVGVVKLDPTTHDPAIRPVGLFEAGPPVKQLASWNIGNGADFKVLAKP